MQFLIEKAPYDNNHFFLRGNCWILKHFQRITLLQNVQKDVGLYPNVIGFLLIMQIIPVSPSTTVTFHEAKNTLDFSQAKRIVLLKHLQL